MIKKITRKGGARSVAELLCMDEQERLELLVTSGRVPNLNLDTLTLNSNPKPIAIQLLHSRF